MVNYSEMSNQPDCLNHQDLREYLTIIPRDPIGSESIAHVAEGRTVVDLETMKARGIIVLVKSS